MGRLQSARSVCVFTGAGMSAESGIATFRDEGGFWERYPVDDFATPGGLLKTALAHPDRLVAFLLDVLRPMAMAAPNPGHQALARLAELMDVTVVTQNIDGLHQASGQGRVLEVHGSLFEIVDKRGQPKGRLGRDDFLSIIDELERLPRGRMALLKVAAAVRPLLGLSATGITHRPNVVLFGEALAEPDWARAQDAADECDAMILVGTSGEVFPAALLPERVRRRERPVVGVGPEPGAADVWLPTTAAVALPALYQRLAEARGA